MNKEVSLTADRLFTYYSSAREQEQNVHVQSPKSVYTSAPTMAWCTAHALSYFSRMRSTAIGPRWEHWCTLYHNL